MRPKGVIEAAAGANFAIGWALGGHEEAMADAAPALSPPVDDLGCRKSGVQRTGATPETRIRGLLAAHFDFIWRSLRRLGLSSADADDAAQQVFWVAARKLERIEEGRERAFLFGTAVRVAADARRAAGRRIDSNGSEFDAPDPLPGPEELTERSRARKMLDDILDSMPLDMRTAFVLFELEELSVGEIATLCDIPVGTVASRLRRARELFRLGVKRHRARQSVGGGGT